MDTKNVIAAISLSAAVIILYSLFFAPSPEEIRKNSKNTNQIEKNSETFDEAAPIQQDLEAPENEHLASSERSRSTDREEQDREVAEHPSSSMSSIRPRRRSIFHNFETKFIEIKDPDLSSDEDNCNDDAQHLASSGESQSTVANDSDNPEVIDGAAPIQQVTEVTEHVASSEESKHRRK